jgi:phasin family protein
MSNSDGSKAAGKSGQRKSKPRQQSKKADQRPRAQPDQQAKLDQQAKPDQQADLRQEEVDLQQEEKEIVQEEKDVVEAEVAPEETLPIEAEPLAPASPVEAEARALASPIVPAVTSIEPRSKGTLVPIDAFPLATAPIDALFNGFQTIANAYVDYARRSIEETFSLVEKLAAVRSPDKAVELQSEFAKQACGTLLNDSQKIWRLYGELARQVCRPFERLMMRMTQTAR